MLKREELNELSKKLRTEPDDYMHSFRRNLSLYIDQKEITLQEVSELADIPLSTLKSFLYGDSRDCSLSLAVKLARTFGITLDEMVGAGTLGPERQESIQLLRVMPESFTQYMRWLIRFNYEITKTEKVTDKVIEIMTPTIGESGNMNLSTDISTKNISHLSDSIKPKVFTGIKMVNDMYAPQYFKGDILYLANDRKPLNGERVIVCYPNSLWIVECRYETDKNGVTVPNYYSIRDGGLRATHDQVQFIIGYIVKVERG